MLLIKSIINVMKNEFGPPFARTYATIFKDQFDVSQFCSLVVKAPYIVNVKPLDPFVEQDKIIVSLECPNDDVRAPIKLEKVDEVVTIDSTEKKNPNNVRLNVNLPIKANLDVTGRDDPVNIGSFYGEKIMAKSNIGNISLDKSQCNVISLSTKGGNIVCNDLTQAGTLELSTKLKGSITTDRIQAISLTATTTSGEMIIGSCYSENSIFTTDFGILRLRNLHKNVNININHEGLLYISGFDGNLKAKIKKGLADVQVSRVNDQSEITMAESGSLILRLSEECQRSTLVKLLGGNFVIGGAIKMKAVKNADNSVLTPLDGHDVRSSIVTDCRNAHVLVDSLNWSQMFEQSFNKV